jgi:hypothetical protein
MADIKALASAISDDGGQIYIYGTATADKEGVYQEGDLIYLILEREGATWKATKTGKVEANGDGEMPPADKITGLDFVKSTLVLNVSENDFLETWQSTNDMRTFTKANIS